MNVRRVNLALWGATAVMSAAAVGIIALAVLTPVDVEVVSGSASESRSATTRSTDDAVLALASFEPVWGLELRKSFDAAPATVAATAPAAMSDANRGLGVTLVGTIGDSLALIQTAAGAVEVKGVGESAGGVKVVAVRPAEVDVEMGGRVVTLKRPKDPHGG